MLFNSYFYLLVFLPIALLGYHLLSRAPFRLALGWLVLVSLYFYGIWNPDPNQPWSPKYLLLIVGSCVFNYLLGRRLSRLHKEGETPVPSPAWRQESRHSSRQTPPHRRRRRQPRPARLLQIRRLPRRHRHLPHRLARPTSGLIVLPLAISFFTFLQIAYLVDAYRGETEEYHFTDYLLFVTFFPHLIAGPLIHHREMMPQFERNKRHHGLAPKDFSGRPRHLPLRALQEGRASPTTSPASPPRSSRLAAADGRDPTMAEAWVGAIAYTLQLYFDFSGYSDMALGAARLFGIRFPLNFHSPYKADSIVEFWRRWHMTLSRFLRDYLYIPLGGNRKGPARRYVNLFLTMLLGGLWHGAGWTFVMWGALHGLYLCLNHAWFGLRKKLCLPAMPKPLAIGLTFLAVLVGWVFFSAHDFASANRMLASMAGLNGFDGWPPRPSRGRQRRAAQGASPSACSSSGRCPNTQEFFARYRPALDVAEGHRHPPPAPAAGGNGARPGNGCSSPCVVLYAVGRDFDQLSEFIYFQF